MSPAIPNIQPTYVCESCDFPRFDDVEETCDLRNLRLDSVFAETRSNTFLTLSARTTFLLRVL